MTGTYLNQPGALVAGDRAQSVDVPGSEPPLFDAGTGALYQLLLASSEVSVADLASRSGLPISDVRAALSRLARHGLVRSGGGRPRLYAANDPAVVLGPRIHRLEADLERERHLLASSKELYAAGRSAHARNLLEIIPSKVDIVDRFLQSEATVRNEVLVFDCPPYILPPGDPRQEASENALLARGVSVRSVYDKRCLDDPVAFAYMAEFSRAGEQIRLAGNVPIKLVIFDGSMAILPLGPDSGSDCAVIVRTSTVLTALTDLFERVWAEAVPFLLPGGAAAAADGAPSGRANGAAGASLAPDISFSDQLLSLLAAGLGDAAIGRLLRVSERTVGRHVRALMDELGALTRFQAGVESVRRSRLGGQ
ncbi:MAG: helix-turn-helix transcriptional regulator [Actinomycetia bacterium]|nr:helix-turn-helix transcriptional regulator [Actinomycetes bacterium]